MPRPALPSPPPPRVVAPPPAPVTYRPEAPRAWWYPVGLWVILSGFLLILDVGLTGGITWSYWPVGILGIFMAGFPLLHRLEAWSLARAGRPR